MLLVGRGFDRVGYELGDQQFGVGGDLGHEVLEGQLRSAREGAPTAVRALIEAYAEGSAPTGDPEPLVASVWALSVGIVTLWLDGPLEDRCVTLGTTPVEARAASA